MQLVPRPGGIAGMETVHVSSVPLASYRLRYKQLVA
jgi:hypothetical protein